MSIFQYYEMSYGLNVEMHKQVKLNYKWSQNCWEAFLKRNFPVNYQNKKIIFLDGDCKTLKCNYCPAPSISLIRGNKSNRSENINWLILISSFLFPAPAAGSHRSGESQTGHNAGTQHHSWGESLLPTLNTKYQTFHYNLQNY